MSDKTDIRQVPQRDLLTLFAAQAVLFSCVGLGLWQFSGRAIDQFVVLDLTDATGGILLGLALSALAWMTYRVFPDFSERMTRLQAKNYAFLANPFPLYAIVALSICAGVGEEALFRGGLQTYLTDWLGLHVAVILSSAVFAMIHWAKPVITVIIFGIGVFFGYVYWLTDSLLLVMIGHTVYDIFAISALKKQFHILGIFDDDAADTNADADPTNG